MGQTHVHAWLPDLLALIEQGLLTPEEIVTHHMPLEEAARGYQIFEKREEACRKVILVPGMQPGKGDPLRRRRLPRKEILGGPIAA